MSNVSSGPLKMTARISKNIVLSLGSLHLTLMAVIGIWFWSSPARFESQQPEHSDASTSLYCTSMSVLGQHISITSSPLRTVSLVMYACFVAPGLNLLVPAALFLTLHISYHRITQKNDDAEPSVVPVYIGLFFLLAVNVVSMIDIETMISLHDVTDESKWTFGQILAVLLLVLPLRDVLGFIMHVRNQRRRKRYTDRLTHALSPETDPQVPKTSRRYLVKKAVKHANILVEGSGTSTVLPAAYQA
jgi:hypothetical protein